MGLRGRHGRFDVGGGAYLLMRLFVIPIVGGDNGGWN